MAGRGRGFDITKRDEASRRRILRRPMTVEEGPLSKKLTELELSDGSADEIFDVVSEVKKLSTSDESLKKAFDLIYKYSHQSKKHSVLGALLFQELLDLQADDVRVRSLLLKSLQKDFEESDNEITNPNKFRNQVTFMCELFCKLRIKDSPIQVLGMAVIKYFEKLLNGNEEDFKVLLELFPKHVEDLENCDPVTFREFHLKLRKKLITDTSLLTSSRALLLALFECSLKRGKYLEPEVVIMYEKFSDFDFNNK